jgi:uncharacterized glyoxalase superfamily protein PhnB
MKSNRSMPASVLIPVIAYPDVHAAADWICAAFGFAVRLRIGDHRVQLEREGASMVVRNSETVPDGAGPCKMMLRVEDVDQAAETVAALGGRIVEAPVTRMYGERQCSVRDPWGMAWLLSETVADVAPDDWLKPQ